MMIEKNNATAQDVIENALASGAYADAFAAILLIHEPEVRGYFIKLLGDRDRADDVFGEFRATLLESLPRYRSECGVRTWTYIIMRTALNNYLRTPENDLARRERMSNLPEPEAREHDRTRPYLKTAIKRRTRELWKLLDEEDQTILVLVVDRTMTYEQVARVLLGPDHDAEAVRKKVDVIKQRIRTAKRVLRKALESEGLIPEES